MDYNEDDIVKFWAKVSKDTESGCWMWQGTKMKGGYGLFDRNRRGVRKTVRSHRFAYTLVIGPIPEGLMLRHQCDTPGCCNPSHLIPGTAKDNSQDMVSRNRHWTKQRPQDIPRGDNHWSKKKGTSCLPRGSAHHNARLSEEKVAEIRGLYEKGGVSQRFLAKTFGVCQGTIWQIVSGNYWKI